MGFRRYFSGKVFVAAIFAVFLTAEPALARPKNTRRTPKFDRAGNVSERDPDEVKQSALTFTHEVQFATVPTLPATILLNSTETEIAQIRALLVLDGKLLTVPLWNSDTKNIYKVQFPSPLKTLSYRFQIILKSDTSFLSDSFSATPECLSTIRGQIHTGEERFPEQHQTVEQAVELKTRAVQLKYWISSLNNMYLGSESTPTNADTGAEKE